MINNKYLLKIFDKCSKFFDCRKEPTYGERRVLQNYAGN